MSGSDERAERAAAHTVVGLDRDKESSRGGESLPTERSRLVQRFLGSSPRAGREVDGTPFVPSARDRLIAQFRATSAAPIQMKAKSHSNGEQESPFDTVVAAEHGLSGPAGPLPHLDRIQRAFGRHDLSGIRARTDRAAADGARAMGAEAFTRGSDVAFAGPPSLHTAAHEAAHAVQQRAGVGPSGPVGDAGDSHEQHADRVADAVVRGQSAEPLLAGHPGAGGATAAATGGGAIQQKVTLKDSGKAERTSGSIKDLTAEVDNTIASKDLKDMKQTAADLAMSIKHRTAAPQIGVEKVEGGHEYRIQVEQQLLKKLNDAIDEIEAAAKSAKQKEEAAKLKQMPDIVKRQPGTGAWGKPLAPLSSSSSGQQQKQTEQ